ncbi:MAG: hypothetical protein QM706_05235 [Nitrospira sp.]
MSRKRFDMDWRSATDKARRIIFTSLSGNGTPMIAPTISPLTLCITGFGWLALASILGMASIVGLVYGTPLPAWWGMLHVHAVLIGGVTQIILGGFLLFVPPMSMGSRHHADTHSFTFWAMNGGVMGMLLGFWLHYNIVVCAGGVLVMAACISVMYTMWIRATRVWKFSVAQSWYYALSLVCLVGGSAVGEIMALGLIPISYGYAQARTYPFGRARLCGLGYHRDGASFPAGGLEPSPQECQACPHRNDDDAGGRRRSNRWILEFIGPH